MKNKNFFLIILSVFILPGAAFAAAFDSESSCGTYCTQTCRAACPGDMSGCSTRCIEVVCKTGYWENTEATTRMTSVIGNYKSENATTCAGSGDEDEAEAPSFEVDRGTPVNQDVSVENPLGETTDPRAVVATVVRVTLIFLGVITLIIFIVSGIMMMTSGGNEERFKKARNAMIYAIIGLAIVLASYSILDFVFRRLLTATGA